MATQPTAPPPPPKKSGMGCLGCGCLFLVLILLGILGFFGFAGYLGFKNLYVVTSPEPEQIPTYMLTEDVYTGAQKKIASFQQDVAAGKTSTLTLSADEVNALIHHNVSLDPYQAQLMVSFDGDSAHLLGSVPTNEVPVISLGIKDRYINLDALTGIGFNAETKDITFQFHKLQLGTVNLPDNSLASLQTSLAQGINQKLHQNADVDKVLQAATSVSITNGQFVVQTK